MIIPTMCFNVTIDDDCIIFEQYVVMNNMKNMSLKASVPEVYLQ